MPVDAEPTRDARPARAAALSLKQPSISPTRQDPKAAGAATSPRGAGGAYASKLADGTSPVTITLPPEGSMLTRPRPVVQGRKAGAKRRLIVLANRLPVQRVQQGQEFRWARSPGGLVTALEPILTESGGVWIGWDGSTGRAPKPFTHAGVKVHSVGMNRSEVECAYLGFANRTLWPLYHDAIRAPEFQRRWWEPYVKVNQRFARAASRVSEEGDMVWVHDFHLQLVPRQLREMRPDVRVGFFLHIPFPPEELFAWLPWRVAVLEGLLGSDVVCFQTPQSARNFARVARKFTSATGTDSELRFEGRRVEVRSIPISIDVGEFERVAQLPKVMKRARDIRERLGPGRRMLLAVDRLDYSKGIDTRLSAYHEALKRKIVSSADSVLVQVAVPSREAVHAYAEMRRCVEETVGRINGEFGEIGRVAVHYFRRSLQREELVAYYLAADVMLVTPLRDGMNLVAKEYVATRLDNSGSLVLSEFAGAAEEFRRALQVNPRDIDGFVGAMKAAIEMPAKDAAMRMSSLRTQLHKHDVFDWAARFLDLLKE